MELIGLAHVQLAIPVGEEDRAREFFLGLLGLQEVPKPPAMAKRGGAWFAGPGFQIHIGGEADFRPARKAHPALVVSNLAACRARFEEAGYPTRDADKVPGVERFHVDDPFGNLLEFLERER